MNRSTRLAQRLADLPQTLDVLSKKYGEWVRDLPNYNIPEQGIEWVAKSLASVYHGYRSWGESIPVELKVPINTLRRTFDKYMQYKKEQTFQQMAKESHPELNPKNPLQYSGTQLQHLTDLHATLFAKYQDYLQQPEAKQVSFQEWLKDRKREEKREKDIGKVIAKFGNLEVYKVTTVKGACELGKGTEWCTRGSDMASRYTSDGPLYIWMDSSNNSPVAQLHYGLESGELEFRDVEDNPVGDYLISQADEVLASENVADYERFNAWINFYDYFDQMDSLFDYGLDDLEKELVESFKKNPKDYDDDMFKAVDMFQDSSRREIADYVSKDTPNTIIALSKYPNLEISDEAIPILSNIVLTTNNFINELSDVLVFVENTKKELSPAATEKIAKDAYLEQAVSYFVNINKPNNMFEKHIIRSLDKINMAEVEQLSKESRRLNIVNGLIKYIQTFKQQGWPELEQRLSQDYSQIDRSRYEDIVLGAR